MKFRSGSAGEILCCADKLEFGNRPGASANDSRHRRLPIKLHARWGKQHRYYAAKLNFISILIKRDPDHWFTCHRGPCPPRSSSAVTFVIVWAASGLFFGYSENWQLVINTSTTVVTFLIVFVPQNSQNRDGMALQAKHDELIQTSQAQNKFVGIEKLDEAQLGEMSQTPSETAEKEVAMYRDLNSYHAGKRFGGSSEGTAPFDNRSAKRS